MRNGKKKRKRECTTAENEGRKCDDDKCRALVIRVGSESSRAVNGGFSDNFQNR